MSRRAVLVGVGGLVVGGVLVGSTEKVEGNTRVSSRLPFYGGFASGIQPDLHGPRRELENVVWGVPTTQKVVALTFDDGPRPNWTPQVLATLAAKDVSATFFLRGDNVSRFGSIHADDGGRHEYGNHTWNHPDLARLDVAACTDQLSRCTAAIRAAYGTSPSLLRPPYGHLGGAALLAADQAGLTTVLWSAQFREASFVDNPEGIVGDVLSLINPGAIVLGHDTGSTTRLIAIDHLGEVIDRLRDEGYRFSTVSAMLAASGGTSTRAPGRATGASLG